MRRQRRCGVGEEREQRAGRLRVAQRAVRAVVRELQQSTKLG
ncbi:MAG: hypothetical protein ABR498_08710 [Candidatus Dormibacteria bacterium]